MSEKSSQEKTQDMCDAVAFGLNEGRKQRRQQPEQTLEDKYRYMCELAEDMARDIFEQKKMISGAQTTEKHLLDFVSNMFELNNGDSSIKDIDRSLSHWRKSLKNAGIDWERKDS
tara:strand:+ start:8979 stop:9323 length:345 start_codon:yes stop_codon:yes gene_type:complete